MAVLDQGLQFQIDAGRVLASRNDGKTVLFAFQGLFFVAVERLDDPVVGPLRQTGNDHVGGVHFLIHDGGREVWVPRNPQPVTQGIGHGGPGKVHRLGAA